MSAGLRIADLAELFGWPGERPEVFAVLRAHIDASFKNGVTAVAGYVGTREAWEGVERKWRKNVTDWRLDRYGGFHLAELPAHVGLTNADLCALTFARIIEGSGLATIGAALEDSMWLEEGDKERHPRAYYRAFEMLLGVLKDEAELALNFPPGEVVLVTDKDAPEPPARQIFDEWKADGAPFVELVFSDRRTTPMIQAADLAVGVMRKGWEETDFMMLGMPKTDALLSRLAQSNQLRFSFWVKDWEARMAKGLASRRGEA